MVITHHGGQCFKITFGERTLAFDPPAKSSSLKAPKFGADIAFISLRHPDMDGAEQAAHGDREPVVINGPGEYEVAGVFARGFPTTSSYGCTRDDETRINTVYLLTFENMKLCFLGALGSTELPRELTAIADDIDLLFLPIGGAGVLEPSEAHKLAVKLEPRVIVPMHWSGIGQNEALTQYLKEEGSEGLTPQEKLTVKKKDVEAMNGTVVVLRA
ncbi:hypothetical protein GVX82_03955 [Patescibacteria group bacterium]|jgi:L-ascorbate metabolism protein UlaG (beta-lactamase superfamily)|nr:hypothetical protein [Patescibacteria group bacterium]